MEPPVAFRPPVESSPELVAVHDCRKRQISILALGLVRSAREPRPEAAPVERERFTLAEVRRAIRSLRAMRVARRGERGRFATVAA